MDFREHRIDPDLTDEGGPERDAAAVGDRFGQIDGDEVLETRRRIALDVLRLLRERGNDGAVSLRNHLVFGFEIMADEPCGNAGAKGDLADGRSLEAEFRNAVQRRLDQFLAPLALGAR